MICSLFHEYKKLKQVKKPKMHEKESIIGCTKNFGFKRHKKVVVLCVAVGICLKTIFTKIVGGQMFRAIIKHQANLKFSCL